jgi:hypothetical protein
MRSYEMPYMRKEFLADELSACLEKGTKHASKYVV